jgi:dCMP deaminase
MNTKLSWQIHAPLMSEHFPEFLITSQSIFSVQRALISDGFTFCKSEALTVDLNLQSEKSICIFDMELYKIKSDKLISVQYFMMRGHDTTNARLLFQKSKNIPEDSYAPWFLNNTIANLQNVSASKNAKAEFISTLKSNNIHVEHKITTVAPSSTLYQHDDRAWFLHEIYIPSTHTIVEFAEQEQDLDFEIRKALFIIGTTGCNYRLIMSNAYYAGGIVSAVEWMASQTKSFASTDTSLELKFARLCLDYEKQRELDIAFLDVADRLALLSKCQSKKVCALAVIDGRIVGTGLNGSIAGGLNCTDVFPDGVNAENRAAHREWSKINEIHAEESLIADAASRGSSGLRGCTVYVSMQPCSKCSVYLTRIGATRVVYRNDYDFGDSEFSRNLFKQCKILFEKESA